MLEVSKMRSVFVASQLYRSLAVCYYFAVFFPFLPLLPLALCLILFLFSFFASIQDQVRCAFLLPLCLFGVCL